MISYDMIKTDDIRSYFYTELRQENFITEENKAIAAKVLIDQASPYLKSLIVSKGTKNRPNPAPMIILGHANSQGVA